jgi:hypothetical protein
MTQAANPWLGSKSVRCFQLPEHQCSKILKGISFMKALHFFSCFSPLILSLNAFAIEIPKNLDFSRTVESSSIIFVPRFEMTSGPVYFKKYIERVVPNIYSFGGLTKITIDLVPEGIVNGEYKNLESQGWVDLKTTWAKSDESICTVSAEVRSFLKHYTPELPSVIRSGNYPSLCSAVLTVLDEDKDQLLKLVSEKPAISIELTVPLCEPSSLVAVTNNFWSLLKESLSKKGSLIQSGFQIRLPLWAAAFEAAKLIQKDPDAIAGDQDETVATAFLNRFDLDLGTKTLSAGLKDVDFPTTLCKTRLLRVQK